MVAALHLGLLALLLCSTVQLPASDPPALVAIDLAEPPPPVADPGGGATIRLERIEATVAPPDIAPLDMATAEPKPPAPATAAPTAGNGLPGAGAGPGSSTGVGTGSGTGVTRARWLSGRIDRRDYPADASRSGVGGSVTVHFDVGSDGRVGGCVVVGSSGNAELDRTTCRLIEARFRYAPARDPAGDPVADIAGWRQDWWLEPRR